jgi:PIN domain nuclease of toxin-antitoxin system
MRLLLDTQLVLWWITHPARIPAAARSLIEDTNEEVYVSRASLWEMAIKVGLGKLRVDLIKFAHQVTTDGFLWLDIENRHILEVASLPYFDDHKDPFDRLLVAQSLSEPLIFLTADTKLACYGSTVRVV